MRTKAASYFFRTFVVLVLTARQAPAQAHESSSQFASPDSFTVILDRLHNLEYDAAQQEIDRWLARDPDNLCALNYRATTMLYREMFRTGALQTSFYGGIGRVFQPEKLAPSPGFRAQLFAVLDKIRSLAEARLRRDPADQDTLYWLGQSHATRAVYYFTLQKDNLAALGEAREAHKIDLQLLALNPHYVDALLVIGLDEYVVGSLPWYAKIVASLAGFHGNRSQGLEFVKRVSEQGHWARDDARFVLALLDEREKKFADALAVLEGLGKSYPRNFLIQEEVAQVYKSEGDTRAALGVYDSMAEKVTAHAPGYALAPAARIFYACGELHQRLGEQAAALERFKEGGELRGSDIYIYRANLAAAGIELQSGRTADAIVAYQRVASAIPNTNEGRAAARALKKLRASAQIGESGSE